MFSRFMQHKNNIDIIPEFTGGSLSFECCHAHSGRIKFLEISFTKSQEFVIIGNKHVSCLS